LNQTTDQAPSNYKAIIRAIHRVALGAGSFMDGTPTPYRASKLYAAPTLEQLQDGGTPFLSVNRGRLIGYADGGMLLNQDVARGVMQSEPVWDFEVFSFHPYDANFPNYDDASDDANNLYKTFMDNDLMPWTQTIIDDPVNDASHFRVPEGTARFFSTGIRPLYIFVNGDVVGTIEEIDEANDIITLTEPMGFQAEAGMEASQGTCSGSYPYNMTPDYAELTNNGGPWCIGYLVVRVFEQLMSNYPS
jgi:hypothetical protein